MAPARLGASRDNHPRGVMGVRLPQDFIECVKFLPVSNPNEATHKSEIAEALYEIARSLDCLTKAVESLRPPQGIEPPEEGYYSQR